MHSPDSDNNSDNDGHLVHLTLGSPGHLHTFTQIYLGIKDSTVQTLMHVYTDTDTEMQTCTHTHAHTQGNANEEKVLKREGFSRKS